MGMDERTFGFNRPDAFELIGLIGHKDKVLPRRQPAKKSGGHGSVIRFQIDDIYEEVEKTQTCLWVEMSSVGYPDFPPDPPLTNTDTMTQRIYYHSRLFDVESTPYGTYYHTHFWCIEVCYTTEDELNEYQEELGAWNGSGVEGWEGSNGDFVGCSEVARIEKEDEVLNAPAAFDTEVLQDDELQGCDPTAERVCPLPEKTPGTTLSVQVLSRPCGVDRVQGESESGYVTVKDSTGTFLGGRTENEYAGRQGFAAYMHDEEGDCYWCITWLDMFQEVELIKNVVYSALDIKIHRIKADVWRYCVLPVETIDGFDCDSEY